MPGLRVEPIGSLRRRSARGVFWCFAATT